MSRYYKTIKQHVQITVNIFSSELRRFMMLMLQLTQVHLVKPSMSRLN